MTGSRRRNIVARRLLAGLMIATAAVVLAAVPAGAHPLGNFTVNRYARVEVSGGVVRVYYVLDEAEIPAFQDRQALGADPTRFAESRTADIIGHLQLAMDGTTLPLRAVTRDLSQPMGQGGL